jgi:Tol biopolymer transport system component/DNA-binding winged helix-turn-helix (wHTH) protein
MNTEERPTGGTHKAEFGLFEADLLTGELRRSGIKVRLQSQPFKLLAALLEHPGAVVSRESLQKLLWGSDTTVNFDHSLGIAVNKLRDALGDSAENPRFVETLAKRGYRFIAPVKVAGPSAPEPMQTAAASVVDSDKGHPWHLWASVALGAICVVEALALLARPTLRTPYRVEQVTYSGRVLDNDTDVESFSNSASDGSRIYFSSIENGIPTLSVALAANGEISHFHLPSEVGAPLIGSLSTDGSRIVIHGHLQAFPEQPLWIVPTLGGNARKVPGVQAHDATWMPDGDRLLIANGNDLVIVDPDGSVARKLVTVPGPAFWLHWSPDGRRLRFTLRDPARQTTEIWEVAVDGRDLHPLLKGWNQPASECCGSWTPDGEEFVFQASHGGHSQIWALREKPWYGRDSLPHQITNGPLEYEAPSTVPGSHRIHFIGVSPQFELFHAVPGAQSFAALDQNLNSAALVEYSPDGRWVAWLNTADGSLWRSRTDGSERIELTTPPWRIFSMKWSPDDKSLALMAEQPGMPWKLYLLDTEGGKPTPVLNESRNEADPNWTPNGGSLVFGRPPDRMDSERKPKAIYQVDLASRNITEIPGSSGLFSPRVSPDGRMIVAMRLDQRALMLYDTAQQRWTTLTTHGVGDPCWSHNGQFVYFQDFLETGKPIYRISIPQGRLEQVATIHNLLPISATDYRLIGLAPGDLPLVTARTSVTNLYGVDLRER